MIIKIKDMKIGFVGACILVGATGCSSMEKVKLDSSTPTEAIGEVETMRTMGQKNQDDLYAADSFEEGTEYLQEAKESLADGDENKEIMNDLRVAKAQFMNARKETNNIKYRPEAINDARMHAVQAGVYNSKELSERLEDIDEDVIDDTDDFTETLSPETVSEYQQKYYKLEADAVQHKELARFREIIESAEENDAESLAPNIYKQAKTDLKAAENTIAQNPRDPDQYQESVMKTNKTVKWLDDIMTKLTGVAKGSSEKVAHKLVAQDRKIGRLSTTVQGLETDLTITNTELASTQAQAMKAGQKARYYKVYKAVNNEFSPKEAEVYQQGDKLILRLKDLNFASGSAQIPNNSTELLAKIGSIIDNIKPDEIQVQGHTDSTGSSSYNQQLSKKRANAVKKFLTANNYSYDVQAVGYGQSKPLADNSTDKGRKMNRRVDIIIDMDKNNFDKTVSL